MTERLRKRNKETKRNLYLIFFLLFTVLLLNSWRNQYILTLCNRITIATVTGGAGSPNTRKALVYFYKYKNKEFIDNDGKGLKDFKSFMELKEQKNKRYFVRFSCTHPDISELCWEVVVPDTLQYIPTNGWDKIPYGLDTLKR